jgi:hypothetical protein
MREFESLSAVLVFLLTWRAQSEIRVAACATGAPERDVRSATCVSRDGECHVVVVGVGVGRHQ